MLKAALIYSAICTAFLVGGRTLVPSQDKPAEVVKPANLQEVLKPLVGTNCHVYRIGSGLWYVSFEKNQGDKDYKFDLLGADFIGVSSKQRRTHIPFSAIANINTD